MEWRDQWFGIIPWATATSRVAAANMLDFGSAKFNGITSSNTLQVAGIDLSSIGVIHPKSADYESIVHKDAEKGTYFKAVIKDNIIVGAICLGDRKIALKLRGLVNKNTDVSGMKQTLFDND